jgi:hypothetical protein
LEKSSNRFTKPRFATQSQYYCFEVGSDLRGVLAFGFLDFPVGFEVRYGPTGEFSRALLKGEIDNSLKPVWHGQGAMSLAIPSGLRLTLLST